MININDVLYKYILGKYGSIAAFSDYSEIPLIELNAILIKDNISIDIRSGLKLCKKLNIDIEKLIFEGKIEVLERKEKPKRVKFSENQSSVSAENIVSENELLDRYIRLSELEKKEVLEFVDKITERHEDI